MVTSFWSPFASGYRVEFLEAHPTLGSEIKVPADSRHGKTKHPPYPMDGSMGKRHIYLHLP